jgi:hypothetical protein
VETLVKEHDLGLAAASALVVMGLIFNVFALVAYAFKVDHDLAFIMGCFGTAFWLAAVLVWYFFLADPEPKHGKRR